jgi:hypothetical protein
MRGLSREKVRLRRGAALLVLVVAITGLVDACGGTSSNGDTGAGELARQRELSEARHQAAQDARQGAKIEHLERELHTLAREKRGSRSSSSSLSQPRGGEQEPVTEPDGSDWPGGSGFTAILASVSSQGEATSVQAEATGRGLDAGVLSSSDYSSLRPGYRVVFSGVFPSVEGAEARTSHAHELGYSDAYPRFVAP